MQLETKDITYNWDTFAEKCKADGEIDRREIEELTNIQEPKRADYNHYKWADCRVDKEMFRTKMQEIKEILSEQ